MHADSFILNPLGIPPIQIGREPLVATELIRLARYDAEMLGNVGGLVTHMRKFLDEEIGWAPQDGDAIREKVKFLLRRVR